MARSASDSVEGHDQKDATLREWMVEYQGGSAGAFDRLYAALSDEVYAYLATLCLDASWTNDLFQECFLQIHRARHTYLADRPVKPWVFGIARHVFRTHRRATRRRAARERSGARVDRYVEEMFQRLIDRDVIAETMVHVAPGRREALVLHHALGWSFVEIGRLLNVSAGTARVRAHRGMADLRRHIATQAEGQP